MPPFAGDNSRVTDSAARPPAVAWDARCPCLSGTSYGECCAPFHRGVAFAPTAERLMRSRYSAFATGDARYLLATWHPSTRPDRLEVDTSVRWFRLDILSTSRGGMLDDTGTVEFSARFRSSDGAGEQHESSAFVREKRQWFYLGEA
jgi:SEC-C motif-containing protein